MGCCTTFLLLCGFCYDVLLCLYFERRDRNREWDCFFAPSLFPSTMNAAGLQCEPPQEVSPEAVLAAPVEGLRAAGLSGMKVCRAYTPSEHGKMHRPIALCMAATTPLDQDRGA